MATSPMNEVIQQLRRSVLLPDGAGLTDDQLLACFIERQDEAAFAALVQRHGPMVWGVSRRVLRDHHEAEDAFQATFLVLARKAASIVPRRRVANWLYGVAYRTAVQARRTVARRRARERPVPEMPEPAIAERDLWRDLEPLLDQELCRLPDAYRAVIVLCDLEGKSRKETARQLGLPEGTVASRLARARVMLAKRVARRGVTLSGGALAGLLTQKAASAGVPTSLISSTIKAGCVVAAGPVAAAGLISVQVAALTEGVLKAMLRTKLAVATALLLAACLLAPGLGVAGFWMWAGTSGEPAGVAAAPTKQAKEAARVEQELEKLRGASIAVGCDRGRGFLEPGRESQKYKALFIKTLGVMAEHFEQINYANQYDGRIEAWSPRPAGEPHAVVRQGVVEIRTKDEGGYSISVRIHKGTTQESEWTPIGRDRELERVIMRQLGAQQDQTEKLPARPPGGSSKAKEPEKDRKRND
jgi:RNA polymerase sigma factor (sigma-70 family)